jgi:predicted nucleic acid-binding protein
MIYSSYLNNDSTPLVLDTSVIINLHASTFGEQILSALPNGVLVPQIVVQELEHETSYLNGEYWFILDLIANGKVHLAILEEREYELFEEMISTSPSLDDGEAATIAIAACRGFVPVIDEKKGRARAKDFIPNQAPAWSLDLFRHAQVVAALGEADSIHCLHLALRDGRMRIHSNHCEQVVKLIGVQRALFCVSLPDFKRRRAIWTEEVSRLAQLHTEPDGDFV